MIYRDKSCQKVIYYLIVIEETISWHDLLVLVVYVVVTVIKVYYMKIKRMKIIYTCSIKMRCN